MLESAWHMRQFIFSAPDPSALRADPITVITAATAVYGAVSAQDQARRANNAADAAKADKKKREDQLAAEAAAAELAKKKAETAGQRAGFGDTSTSALSRSSFIGGGGSSTGMGAGVKEDNLGRGSLFGN